MYLPSRFERLLITMLVGLICLICIALLCDSVIQITHSASAPEIVMRSLFGVVMTPVVAFFTLATHYRFCVGLPTTAQFVEEALLKIPFGAMPTEVIVDNSLYVFHRCHSKRTDIIMVTVSGKSRKTMYAKIHRRGFRAWEKGYIGAITTPPFSEVAMLIEYNHLNNVQTLYRLLEAVQSVDQPVRRE